MLRKTVILLFVASLFSLTFVTPGFAAIDTGPWLVALSDNGVAVRWESSDPTGQLEYGETNGLGTVIPSIYEDGVHEVFLTCLDSDTKYYYKVTAGAVESDVEWFYTAATGDDPFMFAVFGDNRNNLAEHTSVVNAIIAESPDFVLNTGDLVDIGAIRAQWDDFWIAEQPMAKNYPIFPVMGNHELYGGQLHFRKFFSSPYGRDEYASTYAFVIGNSFFISIDITRSHVTDSEQYLWVEQMLQIASEAPEIKHCFVQAHLPPYSCSSHGEDLDVRRFRNVMVPLFEQYGIDLNFAGHDHNYQHSLVNGINYIVAGGGGAPTYSVHPEDWTVEAEEVLSYVLVEVNGTQVTVTGKRFDGTTIESFTLDQDYGVGGGSTLPKPCSELDFDQDGISDGDEFLECTSPYTDDTDNDGFDDGTEVYAGSDPCDPESTPAADDDDDDDSTDDDDQADDDDIADDDDMEDDDDAAPASDDDDDDEGCCG